MQEIDDRHYLKGPWLLLLWGAPAAGKTTLARNILDYWADRGVVVPHLSSDQINRALIGDAFRKELRPAIYRGLMSMAAEILEGGNCLVLDGTFLDQETRNQVRSLPGTQLHVQVTCPLALRLERNAGRGPAERVPEEWVRNAHYKADFGKRDASLVIDTSELAYGEARDLVLEAMGRRLRRACGLMLR